MGEPPCPPGAIYFFILKDFLILLEDCFILLSYSLPSYWQMQQSCQSGNYSGYFNKCRLIDCRDIVAVELNSNSVDVLRWTKGCLLKNYLFYRIYKLINYSKLVDVILVCKVILNYPLISLQLCKCDLNIWWCLCLNCKEENIYTDLGMVSRGIFHNWWGGGHPLFHCLKIFCLLSFFLSLYIIFVVYICLMWPDLLHFWILETTLLEHLLIFHAGRGGLNIELG